MFEPPKAKWELIAERELSLIGTKVVVVYIGGYWPYHVHRANACHGMFEKLSDAKDHCTAVVLELMEMGIEP